MTKCISVAGVIFQVTDDFDDENPEDMAALTDLAEYLATRSDLITPEEQQRQAEARDRIRERNRRIRGERP